MAKCGRGAFLFRTDKQAIQCNRELTIVPNQTCGRCPPHRQFEALHRPPEATHRQLNTASKRQIARERCPNATNREAAKSCHQLCHPIIRNWVARDRDVHRRHKKRTPSRIRAWGSCGLGGRGWGDGGAARSSSVRSNQPRADWLQFTFTCPGFDPRWIGAVWVVLSALAVTVCAERLWRVQPSHKAPSTCAQTATVARNKPSEIRAATSPTTTRTIPVS
jgi:hypothetical protein